MIYGIDISNHQGKGRIDLDKVLTKNPKTKFVIVKVSEGVNFTDIYADKFIKIALAHGCVVGVYHYAHPEKNSALAEAKFFMSLANKYKGKVFYVLDWEVKAGADKSTWAEAFLDYVAKETDSTPMFYTYESMENAHNYSCINDYPLWIAKYRDYGVDYNYDMSSAGSKPKAKNRESYIMWQWTSVGRLDGYSEDLDCNVFYGTVDDLRKYIGKAAPVEDKAEEKPLYTFDITNPVKISNSGSDENGNYRNGKAGDQTGNEWRIRDWYNRPWNCVLRHPDANVRAEIAHLAVLAANNDKIGYDQNQRDTFWTQLQANDYDPSKIDVACESDCSAGVIAITKATGYLLDMPKLRSINATYTGNMRQAYKNAGFQVLTSSKYISQDDYLVAGDILLNDAHHVATAVTNGVLSGADKDAVKEDAKNWGEDMPLLKRGSKGKAVEVIQVILGGLTVDGDFGWKTLNKVLEFQRSHGLEPDGEVGENTWSALLNTL